VSAEEEWLSDVLAAMPLEGTGRLYAEKEFVCEVTYRLIGWCESGTTESGSRRTVEIRGALRRVDCRILTTWGNAVSREGGLHRRERAGP